MTSTEERMEFGGGCDELRAACPWIPDEHCGSCHTFDEGLELEHDGKLYTVCWRVSEHYDEKPA